MIRPPILWDKKPEVRGQIEVILKDPTHKHYYQAVTDVLTGTSDIAAALRLIGKEALRDGWSKIRKALNQRGAPRDRIAFWEQVAGEIQKESPKPPKPAREKRKIPPPADPLLEAFARDVQQRRKNSGMTITELATRMGTTPTIISRLENGKYNPSLKFMFRLAEVVGFDIIPAFFPKTKIPVWVESGVHSAVILTDGKESIPLTPYATVLNRADCAGEMFGPYFFRDLSPLDYNTFLKFCGNMKQAGIAQIEAYRLWFYQYRNARSQEHGQNQLELMLSRVAHGWIKSICNRPGFAREKVLDDWQIVVERMRRHPDISSQFVRFAETLSAGRSFPKEESAINACREGGILNSWLTTVRNTPIDSSHWAELVRVLRSWLEGMDKETSKADRPAVERPARRSSAGGANSIVLELQKEAMDHNVPVSALLRKALVVAKKLDNPEFEEWIDRELNGYPAKAKFPGYRVMKGEVKGLNPYRGWIPMAFLGEKDAMAAETRKCNQTVAELETLVNRKNAGSIGMRFPADIEKKLCETIGFQTEIMLFIQPTSLIRILDAVRNIILNWTLKLEKAGVLGAGMSFTAPEMAAATRVPQNVTNFYGDVRTARIQQDSPHAVQIATEESVDVAALSALLTEIRDALDRLRLPAPANAEARAYIASAEIQTASPKPGFPVVKHCLAGLQRILGAAGDTFASKIAEKIAAWVI